MSKCQIGGNMKECSTACKKEENERYKLIEEREHSQTKPSTISKISGFFKKHYKRLTRKRDNLYDNCTTKCKENTPSVSSHTPNHTSRPIYQPMQTRGGKRGRRNKHSKRSRRYSRRR